LDGGSRIWIEASIFNNWKPGPASIIRSESKTGTTSASKGSSDTVSGGISWGVVSARARVFKKAWSFPERKRVSYRKSPQCPKLSDSYTFRARMPVTGNSNANYCDARDKWPASKIIPHATCTNV
jgi:hypothetical protein